MSRVAKDETYHSSAMISQRIPSSQSGVREELNRIKAERLAKRAALEAESK